MKKNGFTLIELLAVIVILAIIALIAVPIVLNIINNSKESAKIRSSELYLDAVKNSLASSQLGDNQISNGTYEIMSDGNICLGTITDGVCDNTLEVSVDGEIPDSGTITITNGKITDFSLYYGTDKVAKDETGNLIYEENMAPGLYDNNGKLLASFDELVNDYGVDIEKDYTYKAANSPAAIINDKFPKATRLIIGNNLQYIGVNAFRNCESLISIEVPSSVTNIGMNAFYSCKKLMNIKLPNNLISLGKGAFWNCESLINVIIPSNITELGNGTFGGCSSLKSIEIPDKITSIGTNTFYDCINLTSITIPSSVVSISVAAFSGCSGLETIIVDENNTVYDSRENSNAIIETSTNTLIAGCKTTIIPADITSIGQSAFYRCGSLKNINIPVGVTSIGRGAFQECTSLTSIELPNSITSIGLYAFGKCGNLETIVVDEKNAVYDSRNNSNAIIETSTNTLILGCKNTIIPDSVNSLGDYAFYGCKDITSIEIPNNVTIINKYAFWECNNLKSITILGDVTNIGDYAFMACTSLTSIEIPSSVTSIGGNTFQGCTNLTTIYYKGTSTGKPWGATNATVVTDF